MANNRLYLRCKCGGHLYLGRHFGDGWWCPPHPESHERTFSQVLNEFYSEHEECFYKWYDNPFCIITENDEYDEENMELAKEKENEK